MVYKDPNSKEQVSNSMICSVFNKLKSNGYSDSQILALSSGLAEMANRGAGVRDSTICSSGLDELEALCSAGLPYQL